MIKRILPPLRDNTERVQTFFFLTYKWKGPVEASKNNWSRKQIYPTENTI